MLKKFYILVSAMVLTAFVAVSGAQAVSVDPSFSDTYFNNSATAGPIDDIYTFTATEYTNLQFILSINHPGAPGGHGIDTLELVWSLGGILHSITDSNGDMVGGLNPVTFFHTLVPGDGDVTLHVTGDFFSTGGGYNLTVAAVPLPPAVIAFATAMLGVGFLARRRRKSKETFA